MRKRRSFRMQSKAKRFWLILLIKKIIHFIRSVLAKIWFFLLILLIILVCRLVASSLIIQQVICISQYDECNNLYNDLLKDLKGGSYLNSKKSAEIILQNSPLVSDYRIKLNLPSSLVINTIENKAKFALYDKNRKLYIGVDKDGKVVSESTSCNLPIVIIEMFDSNKGVVNEEELFSLRLVYDIYNILGIKQGIIEDNGMVLNLSEGYKIILPLQGNRRLLVGSLLFLLNEIDSANLDSENSEKIDTIDLRYKNPVLKY